MPNIAIGQLVRTRANRLPEVSVHVRFADGGGVPERTPPALPLNAVVGQIGKYRIDERIGAGGMGEVYRATDLLTWKPVAVKALNKTGRSGTAVKRFRNEAVIQYNLRHPSVAQLYEYFSFEGKPCFAMEFIGGRTLHEWIRGSGPLAPLRAIEILEDICGAVSYMHSKGVVHRDIKAANILIDARGKARLLDFGIAVSGETPVFAKPGHSAGTPQQMAPEQHRGSRGDARSDVWALGLLFYEMVTGVPPFANTNPDGLRQDITAGRYLPAQKRKPALPGPVVRLIATCLRLKPEERYASAGVLLREVKMARLWLRVLALEPAYFALALGMLFAVLVLYGLGAR